MKAIHSNQLFYQHKPYLDGSEANIYVSTDGRRLLKKFNKNISIECLEKKKIKLLQLSELDHLKDIYPNIISFVYDNYQFMGYIMDFYRGYPLDEISLTFDEKVNLLNDLKQKILRLQREKIYYFDLHFDNILCLPEDKLHVKLIDMDNIQIGKYSSDTVSFLLKQYLKLGGKTDNNALIYIFNVMSYHLLTSYYDLENPFKINYEQIFIDNQTRFICNDLFSSHIDSLCDHEFLIDSIEHSSNGKKILLK